MITTIMGLLGLAGYGSGILGVAGVALKLLGKFAPGAAATVLSNPITAAIGKVAEGFVDLIGWAVKGVLTYIGTRAAGALDHIFSNGFAGALFIASLVVAYEVGGIGRPEAKPPPAVVSAPAKASPKAQSSKPPTSAHQNPLDWFESILR